MSFRIFLNPKFRSRLPFRVWGSDRIAYGGRRRVIPLIFWLGIWRLLQPVFAKPAAWRVLDVIIGTVMSLLAISLLVRFLRPA
jgi:L-lysine exporter family protein LysE/ArgO